MDGVFFASVPTVEGIASHNTKLIFLAARCFEVGPVFS